VCSKINSLIDLLTLLLEECEFQIAKINSSHCSFILLTLLGMHALRLQNSGVCLRSQVVTVGDQTILKKLTKGLRLFPEQVDEI